MYRDPKQGIPLLSSKRNASDMDGKFVVGLEQAILFCWNNWMEDIETIDLVLVRSGVIRFQGIHPIHAATHLWYLIHIYMYGASSQRRGPVHLKDHQGHPWQQNLLPNFLLLRHCGHGFRQKQSSSHLELNPNSWVHYFWLKWVILCIVLRKETRKRIRGCRGLYFNLP